MAAVHPLGERALAPFLLGMAEAGFFPGVLYYLTQWFPATHRGRAITRFYFALPISAAVMAALAGPLLALDGRLGLAGWQWLFLLEGAPAIVLGMVILSRLPETPSRVVVDPGRTAMARECAVQ